METSHNFINTPAINTTLSNQTDTSKTSEEEYDLVVILHYVVVTFVALHLIYFLYMLIKNNICKKRGKPEDQQENLRKINDECSICLESIRNEVQLLCSHSYCAACIIDYGKQRWGFVNIQCPICRTESKLMVTQFERNEENKELYDMILSYNHEITAAYSTSFCLCFDILKFSFFYFRQITNFSNPRYRTHRKIIILLIIIVLVFVLYPATYISDHLELFEDILSYIFLILLCSENFYRRIRRETNSEFILHESEINSRNSSRFEENEGNGERRDVANDDSNLNVQINRINDVPNSINQV
jgi:hypothetical protein